MSTQMSTLQVSTVLVQLTRGSASKEASQPLTITAFLVIVGWKCANNNDIAGRAIGPALECQLAKTAAFLVRLPSDVERSITEASVTFADATVDAVCAALRTVSGTLEEMADLANVHSQNPVVADRFKLQLTCCYFCVGGVA
jgi:hypothetical protein